MVAGNGCVLVTANVGSIFEVAELMPGWVAAVSKAIVKQGPVRVVAVHFQEVGGKAMGTSVPEIKRLLKLLKASPGFKGLSRVAGYMDTDADNKTGFTALGALFFVSAAILSVERWNFSSQRFVKLKPSANAVIIEGDSPFVRKNKFQKGEFGWVKKSRKGFLHSRWRLEGCEVNFVCVHLFHDDSNLVAAATTAMPSRYAQSRAAALKYTLAETVPVGYRGGRSPTNDGRPRKRARIEGNAAAAAANSEDEALQGSVPLSFYFGDLNSRLSLGDALREMCDGARPELARKGAGHRDDPEIERRYMPRHGKEPLVVVNKKSFAMSEPNKWLDEVDRVLQFDRELAAFTELREFPITFSPTYPFSEGTNAAEHARMFLGKRAPAWCDRVLMTEGTLEVVQAAGGGVYDSVGVDACMGDHKPVLLSFNLPA